MSAGTRLCRALSASACAAGCPVRIASVGERPWTSATFVGTRHALHLEASSSPSLAAWLAALPTAALAVPGHVVAEMVVEHAPGGATVAALTLEA